MFGMGSTTLRANEPGLPCRKPWRSLGACENFKNTKDDVSDSLRIASLEGFTRYEYIDRTPA